MHEESASGERGALEDAHYWRHGALPGIDLLRARYVTHRFTRHAHDGYVVAVVFLGVEAFHYRGELHRAGPGQVIILNPDQDHTGQAGDPDGWAYRVLYPPVDVMTEIAADLSMPTGTPYFADAVVPDPHAVRLLIAAHQAAEQADSLVTSTLTRTAFGHLLRRHASPPPARRVPSAGQSSVRLAREILHERLADPPALEDLAAAVQARPFPLLRAFKQATGLPPHAYLNTVRVRRARQLLDAGVPPAQVAADVGFTDQAHLTRHFKRVVGVTPGAYQRARLGVIRQPSSRRESG
ncbi:AraC family transcriptional regulator [Thermopolyspora sp. NPDC052614]|uniref:AraC family transcriptional regulator n=1 Tax=Thermopolyspora sp. NPDC052614 TaxID=3155682 RepID=UPI00342868EC